MKSLVAAALSCAVLLTGCTDVGDKSGSKDDAPQTEAVNHTEAGVTVTSDADAVPAGTEVAVERDRIVHPLAATNLPGLHVLGPAAQIAFDDGDTQPATPLTVTIDVPKTHIHGNGPVGAILQSEGGDPEYLPGTYDRGTGQLTVEVPHLSWIWPIQLDVSKLANQAVQYVLEATGIAPARPDCDGEDVTIGDHTYSAISPANAWVCVKADSADENVIVEVQPRTPIPFLIATKPKPRSAQFITDLGDESTIGAAIVRGLGLAKGDQGLLGPGVGTHFLYDGAQPTTLGFRAEPGLLLVQILIATLQPVLSVKKIETLSKLKCFHDVIETAQETKLNVSAAASLTGAVFSCIGEVAALTPAAQVVLAVVSAAPQLLVGNVLGAIGELTGTNNFNVTIEEGDALPQIPRTFLGDWYVHGVSLIVRRNGTAESVGHSSCPDEWGSDMTEWCNDVVTFDLSMESDGRLRLTVIDFWVEDTDGRRGTPDYVSGPVGAYYLMKLLPGGEAITELHTGNEVVTEGGNGLGNPYLCRPGSKASQNGSCGA